MTGALLLFACVLLHELGHALTARAFGIPVPGMTLFIFGGVAHIAREATRPSIELRIAIAGPLVSLALAAACRLAAGALPMATPLQTVAGAKLSAGRVAIDRGYMGVLKEVRRLLAQHVGAPDELDFELLRTTGVPEVGSGWRASSAGP
jgi:hypothetical protein